MAHFRGIIQGNRGEASRLGSKASGLVVEAQSWEGKVVVYLHHDHETGQDRVLVQRVPHEGSEGAVVTLYDGPVFIPEEE